MAARPTFVGGASQVGTGSTITVDLTALAGGSDAAPQEGDLVVVVWGHGDTSNRTMSVSTSGYTVRQDLYQTETWDPNLGVAWKFMGSTPDSSVVVNRQSNAAYGGAAVVHVWRGVDPTTPFDVADVTALGTNSHLANPGAITPQRENSVVLACGIGTQATTGAAFTIPSGMTNGVSVKGDGTTADAAVFLASYDWTSGSYDPAAVTGGTGGTSAGWIAVTMALRPHLIPPVVTDDPDNASTVAGQTATFTVSATGATGYQWQDDSGGSFANISGETGSSYTTAALTTAASGRQVRCVVTNADGAVNSAAATLTVSPALYYVVATGTEPTGSQIKAGQDSGGSAAAAAGFESARTTDGEQVFASPASGLAGSTLYRVSLVWTDGTEDSNVVSTTFTTSAGSVTPPRPSDLLLLVAPPAFRAVRVAEVYATAWFPKTPEPDTAVYDESITETASASDVASAVAVLVAALTESATASEAASAVKSTPASLTESAAAADTPAATMVAGASLTESASASDAIAPALTANPSVVESASASDAATNTALIAAVLTETGDPSDLPAGGAALSGDITETATPTDDASATVTVAASLTESASATDAASAVKVTSGAITESAAPTDDAQPQLVANPALSESASPADTVAATAVAVAALTEGATATDAVTATAVLLASVVEAASASDEAVTDGSGLATLTESASASDAITTTATLGVALTEAASATDAASATIDHVVSVTETASPVDAVTNALAAAVSLSESASAVDTPAAALDAVAGLVEAAAATDAPTFSGSGLEPMTESANATDDPSAVATKAASLTESASAVDVVVATVSVVADLTETASPSDAASATRVMPASLTEAAAASDALATAATMGVSLTETASPTDTAAGELTAYFTRREGDERFALLPDRDPGATVPDRNNTAKPPRRARVARVPPRR